jgi:L-fucono-1,5-lactonase
MIIDAHHHLWTADYEWLADPSLAAIRRDYTVADLRAAMTSAGVDRTVLVEGGKGTDQETTEYLALAEATPEILGVVGWASLTAPELGGTLTAHKQEPGGHLLVGIRDQIQAYGVDHLDRDDVRAGLATVAAAGLVNEVVVRAPQLPSVARAAAALPDSTFVLDHLGKPDIAGGGLDEWRTLIEPVAARPNVVAKVSGLVAEADWAQWTVADLRPYVLTAVDLFGTSRLMFGSDWPVLEVAATYAQVKDAVVDILGGTPEDLFAGTALATYQLHLA